MLFTILLRKVVNFKSLKENFSTFQVLHEMIETDKTLPRRMVNELCYTLLEYNIQVLTIEMTGRKNKKL